MINRRAHFRVRAFSAFPRRAILPTLAAITCFASPAAAYQLTPNLIYSSPGAPAYATRLDLYTPNAGPASTATVILLHPGGYTGGSRADLASLAMILADLNYNVVCPEYTLATATQPSFPQAIVDTMNVVRWVRTDGAQMGLSSTIVLSGFSAGATIAANAAFAASTNSFVNQPAPQPRGYVIDAFIGIAGRYDMLWGSTQPGFPGYAYIYVGQPGPGQSYASLFAAASATTYADNCSPPAALYHGAADDTVPFQNTTRLDAALRAAGAPVWTSIVPGGGHNLNYLGGLGGTAWTMAQVIPTLLAASTANCIRNNPVPSGACCAPGPTCLTTTLASCPWSWSGVTTCAAGACMPPPPQGACCAASGSCAITAEALCTGDWAASGSCTPNTCPHQGACCAPDGACTSTFQSDCPTTSAWIDEVCAPMTCSQSPPPSGACCAPDGTCAAATLAACASSGAWTADSTCAAVTCAQPAGACCTASGDCSMTTSAECASPATFAGMGSSCIPNNCAVPTGACCTALGVCSITTSADCASPATFSGTGTSCSPNLCPQPPPPTGACCSSLGACSTSTAAACTSGSFAGPDTLCDPNPCPRPIGACCRGVTCAGARDTDCTGANTHWSGPGTICNAPGNILTPCCRADFNQSGGTSIDDIFMFINAWLENTPAAAYGSNGTSACTIDDVFVYLNAWFGGC